VFQHKGNCDIKIAMFNKRKGLMSRNFDSFNGSIPSGQSLYYTTNGGDTWNLHPKDPTTDFITGLDLKRQQVLMTDYDYLYYSANHSLTWRKQKLPANASPNDQIQFENCDYIVMPADNGFNLIAKRPGSNNWVTSVGVSGGLVSCFVLDGN